MKRKPRGRSRSRRSDRHPSARKSRVPDADMPVASDEAAGHLGSTSATTDGRLGVWLSLTAEGVFFATIVGTYLTWRFAASPQSWPTAQEFGLRPALGLLGTVFLLAGCVGMHLARRATGSSRPVTARVWAGMALLCSGIFLGARGAEYASCYTRGFFPWTAHPTVYEVPDLYYIHAVRVRLQQIVAGLERERTDHPDRFTSDDQQRLGLANDLEKNMVRWTEQEIGHWSDDPRQQRASLTALAYLVYPLNRNRRAVESTVRAEKDDLETQQKWCTALEHYCQRKLELHEQLKRLEQQLPPAPASGSPSATSGGGAQKQSSPGESQNHARTTALRGQLLSLDRSLAQQLDEWGAKGWAFGHAVMADTGDLAMVGERLNQVRFRLEQIDARRHFLKQRFDPLFEQPEAAGLNAAYRWLRLPVSVPRGNSWTMTYYVLTIFHALFVLAGCVIIVPLVFLPFDPARAAMLQYSGWFWYVTTAIWIIIFPFLYLV